jgi:hypothetical protein
VLYEEGRLECGGINGYVTQLGCSESSRNSPLAGMCSESEGPWMHLASPLDAKFCGNSLEPGRGPWFSKSTGEAFSRSTQVIEGRGGQILLSVASR